MRNHIQGLNWGQKLTIKTPLTDKNNPSIYFNKLPKTVDLKYKNGTSYPNSTGEFYNCISSVEFSMWNKTDVLGYQINENPDYQQNSLEQKHWTIGFIF